MPHIYMANELNTRTVAPQRRVCRIAGSLSPFPEIGEDLAKEISSVREKNPAVWTPALEKYIDDALKACIP